MAVITNGWPLRDINFSNGNGSFSFYVFFCSLYNRHRLLMDLIIGVTQWMPYNKQELLTPSPVFWCSPCCSSFLLSAMCFFSCFCLFFWYCDQFCLCQAAYVLFTTRVKKQYFAIFVASYLQYIFLCFFLACLRS